MNTGVKVVLISVGLIAAVVGIETGVIYRRNHEAARIPANPYESIPLSQDDEVMYSLRKERPDSLKDVRAFIGKTLWISAGGQMDYYRDTGNHVDYAKPMPNTLAGATPMLIKGVFEQVAPASGRAVFRIPPGARHVLFAFTLPNSDDPKALYAVPIGNYDGVRYTFYTDQIFFYDDPHVLYKHWGPEMWSHIDKHEAVLGMSENQAMMALGQTMDPHGDNPGDRSITFDNDSHPLTIVFEHNKAVKITPGT